MEEENFNILDLFTGAARKFPDKTAIICKDKKITFAELEKQVAQTATYFLSKGIAKGDRVLIFVPMSMDLYRIVLALIKMGAVAVFLDEWVSKKRMEACCEVAQCKAFVGIFKARVLAFFSGELRKIPIHLGTGYTVVHASLETERTTKSDTALITFTTGSTGTPKAAKRTHGFLLEQFNALIEKTQPQADDIDMPVLPIVLLINLGTGNTSVIADFKAGKPSSLDPEKILQQIEKYRVNRLVASPFFIKTLSAYILKNDRSVSSIKKIFTGGAPVFPQEAAIYVKAFSTAYTEIVFGSTEAEPISSIAAEELLKEKDVLAKGLKVGTPYRKALVKIIRILDEAIAVTSNAALDQLETGCGQIGEIIVSGPHVLSAYFNNDDALKRNKIFVDGTCWHRTGDSGYLDATGVLYLTGRCNTIVCFKDKMIAPFLYEGFFQTLEGIEMGTVLMLQDKLTAVIELNTPALKDRIVTHLKQMEVVFEDIIFTKKIPRDPRHNSKIDYGLLVKELSK